MNDDTLKQEYSSHPIRSWFIEQSLDHPVRSILFSLFATMLMGAGGLFFKIDDDMMKLLPSDLDSKISWDDIQNEFGSTELIYIAFGKKGESVFNNKSFSILCICSCQRMSIVRCSLCRHTQHPSTQE